MSAAIKGVFTQAASLPPPKQRKRPSPLSVRVTDEEKERLEELAGEQSLNAYIRSRILGERSKRNAPHRETLARMLAELGESEIGPSLRTLARSAEIGALILDNETRENLNTALCAVMVMRGTLIKALGN